MEVETISSASNDLSTRTERQAHSLEESATSLERLAESVTQVAGMAEDAGKDIGRVGTVSQTCNEVLTQAVEAMERIVASSNEISSVTELIDQVAFQTNLLALNAAVEAARAGEAGRGFAVVAGEVQSLAKKTSESASEISNLIDKSKIEIEEGSSFISSAGESFREIQTMIAQLDGAIQEVAQSTERQSAGLNEMNSSIKELEQVTQSNAAMFEETAASTTKLKQSVVDLMEESRADDGEPMRPAA